MLQRILSTTTSDQDGFTLVELIIVFAILGVLAAIGFGEYYDRREKAYDRQSLAIARHLLNLAATDFANDDIPGKEGFSVATPPKGFPNLDVNLGTHTLVDATDDGTDIWSFYVATEGGETAYFFWLPGPNCTAETVKGKPSDTIVENVEVPAEDWRGGGYLNI